MGRCVVEGCRRNGTPYEIVTTEGRAKLELCLKDLQRPMSELLGMGEWVPTMRRTRGVVKEDIRALRRKRRQ